MPVELVVIEKKVPASEAPEGAERKLIDTTVFYISLVDAGANNRTFALVKRADMNTQEEPNFFKELRIVKIDEEKRQVYAAVYVPDETDSHGDYMDAETIDNMAADFVRAGRANNVDVQHDFVPGKGFVRESWIVRTGDPMFPGEKAGTWVVSIQITDDVAWGKIKSGDITALSLAGYALVEEVVPDDEYTEETKTIVPYEATSKMDSGTSWDVTEVREHLKVWATKSDDEIDFGKYSRGFAWRIKDNANTLGAYKLPHHDIVDGILKVNLKGVQAAMGALLGTRGGVDIPDDEVQSVYNHLAKHYEQFGEEPPELKMAEASEHKDGTIVAFLKRVILPSSLRKEDLSQLAKEVEGRAKATELVEKASDPYDFDTVVKEDMGGFIVGFEELVWVYEIVLYTVALSTNLSLEEKIQRTAKNSGQFIGRVSVAITQMYELAMQDERKKNEVTQTMSDNDEKKEVTLTEKELEEKLVAAREEGKAAALKEAEAKSEEEKAADEASEKARKEKSEQSEDLESEDGSETNTKIAALGKEVEDLKTEIGKLVTSLTGDEGLVDRIGILEKVRGLSKEGDRGKDEEDPIYEPKAVGTSFLKALKGD